MAVRYVPRIVEGELDDFLSTFGAFLFEGLKWSDKTTTAGTRAVYRLMLDDPALAVSGEAPPLIDVNVSCPGFRAPRQAACHEP